LITAKTEGIALKNKTKDIKPDTWINSPHDEIFIYTKEEMEAFQLEWARKRFSNLKDRIPALKNLAEKQGIEGINSLADIPAISFTHKVFKSYPANLVDKKKFGLMTKWLDKLTTVDLSTLDMKGIKTIDDWLNKLNDNGMYMLHTTGTTGKLGFFPRAHKERDLLFDGFIKTLELFNDNPGLRKEQMPVFFPGYRGGNQTGHSVIMHVGSILAGGEENFHTIFDTPMSADFMSLAGRIKTAAASGNLKKMDMIKAIVKSKGELIKMKKNMPKMTDAFFDNLVNNFNGKRVLVMATAPHLLDAAIKGKEKGITGIFSKDSILLTGGGLKGYDAPDNWEEVLKEFYGVEEIHNVYAMTECSVMAPRCKNGHYHFPLSIVPFLLDVETGEVLPREGVQTGRYGSLDLVAETYWGSVLTGDKVTIHYDDCGCGWKGPWAEDNVRRYSELQEDREDKISCSGSQDAYNEFLEFIAEDAME